MSLWLVIIGVSGLIDVLIEARRTRTLDLMKMILSITCFWCGVLLWAQ